MSDVERPEPERPELDARPSEEGPREPRIFRLFPAIGASLKHHLAPEGSRRRWWWNRFFVQVEPATAQRSEAELRAELGQSRNVDRSLTEAEEAFKEPFRRSEGVERRATTIQAAVAVAASFALTGAGLLLDRSALGGSDWRIPIAVAYLVVVVSLVAAALRALRATTRTHRWSYPDPEGLLDRAGLGDEEAQPAHAAELLYCSARNAPIARYKVAQMRAAGHWLALALIGLAVTATLIACYLVFAADNGPDGSPQEDKSDQVAALSSTLAAFTGPTYFHPDVPPDRRQPLCVARYGSGNPSTTDGQWWTTCREAHRLMTVAEVRQRLALPVRFAADRSVRVQATMPPGSATSYISGRVAAQCEAADEQPPCLGQEYAGGGPQFYFFQRGALRQHVVRRQCTEQPEGEPSEWRSCLASQASN